jgi:hypothetical protein
MSGNRNKRFRFRKRSSKKRRRGCPNKIETTGKKATLVFGCHLSRRKYKCLIWFSNPKHKSQKKTATLSRRRFFTEGTYKVKGTLLRSYFGSSFKAFLSILPLSFFGITSMNSTKRGYL